MIEERQRQPRRTLPELHQLDALSRQRALNDAESRRLERLLHNDWRSRVNYGDPIPRGVSQ